MKHESSKREAKVKRSSEQKTAVPAELSSAITIDAANLFDDVPTSAASFIASAVAATAGGNNANAGTNDLSAVQGENENLDDEAKRMFEMRKKTKVAPAPAGDAEVKAMLRANGQPVCLFGEGPYERRERLRLLIAESDPSMLHTSTVALKTTTQAELDETALKQRFYSEGTVELKAARLAIADYSLPRSVKRLKRERQILISCDPLEMEDRKLAFLQSLENAVDLTSSQVGDQRPLTVGRFSPDGQSFATGSWNSTVSLWNTNNCEARLSLEGHSSRVHSIAWRPTNNGSTPSSAESMSDESSCHLATASADATVMLWSQNSKDPLKILKGHEDRVNRIAFHPSCNFLVSTSHDETWRLWDVSTGQELLAQEGHAAAPYACKVHADGSLVIVGDLCGHVLVWDLRSGKKVMDLLGHVKQVLSIDCNPQIPQQVASASDDNTIRIWDLRKNLSTVTLLAHDKLVTDCVFEPVYGRYLLSASHDCKVKLWQPTEWRCFKTLIGHDTRITSVDISADRSLIGTTGFDRTWKLWKIKPENLNTNMDADWLL